MDNLDLALRIVEILIQGILAILAGLALFTWKREIRGHDQYKLARELLSYLKEVRFLAYQKNGSFHQIYLNDILVRKEEFFKDQLSLISKEKIYFDESIFDLLNHINIRSDLFLPKKIRDLLDMLCPSFGKLISKEKGEFTYIRVQRVGVKPNKYDDLELTQSVVGGAIYQIENFGKDLTFEAYFRRWEKLLIELNKFV